MLFFEFLGWMGFGVLLALWSIRLHGRRAFPRIAWIRAVAAGAIGGLAGGAAGRAMAGDPVVALLAAGAVSVLAQVASTPGVIARGRRRS